MANTNTKLQRVAIYIRVSSDEQAEKGDSIRDQRERCARYIDEHRDMILQDIYIDDGISGQKLDREDFGRLLLAVQNGEIDIIIFTKLDRWFRSLRHYLNTQAILEKAGVSWTAIDQPYFDTSTPYGRAFVAQSMTWAELEAQNGGLRIKDVFKTKVAHGEAITGKVPRGYRIENKHLVLSDEAPAIYDAVQYFCKTQSMGKTLMYLRDVHGMVMTLNNLRESILLNEKLTGRYRDNPNYCPRIISDEMWDTVQSIFDRNQTCRSSQRYPYIFSGLLICKECGHRLTSTQINCTRHQKNGVTRRYRYPAYACKWYKQRLCTNSREFRESHIEAYLLEHIEEELSAYSVEYYAKERAVINKSNQRQAVQKKLDRLKDLYLNEIISLDEYKRDRAQLSEQLSNIPAVPQKRSDPAQYLQLLSGNFKDIYAGMSNEEKRTFWRSIIRAIKVPPIGTPITDFEITFL